MRTLFAALALFSLFFVSVRAADQTTPAQDATPTPVLSAGPAKIHIVSCQVASGISSVPQANEIGLAVRFINESPDELKEIVWRAKYGNGYFDFRDDGQFTPGIRIDNFVLFDLGKAHFNPGLIGFILSGQYKSAANDPPRALTQLSFQPYIGFNEPNNCAIIGTTRSSDEATWTDATVPKDHYQLPTPGPSPKATLAPAGLTKPNDPLDISHCALSLYPVSRGAYLEVGYRNRDATRAVKQIVFRASYGLGTVDFTDVGTFSPDTYIWHQLRQDPGFSDRHFVGFDDPGACGVVSVDYVDGTNWVNTTISPAVTPPPQLPDGIDISMVRRWVNGLAFPAPTPSPSPSVNNSASPSPSPT